MRVLRLPSHLHVHLTFGEAYFSEQAAELRCIDIKKNNPCKQEQLPDLRLGLAKRPAPASQNAAARACLLRGR